MALSLMASSLFFIVFIAFLPMQVIPGLHLDNLDLTSEEIDFSDIDGAHLASNVNGKFLFFLRLSSIPLYLSALSICFRFMKSSPFILFIMCLQWASRRT